MHEFPLIHYKILFMLTKNVITILTSFQTLKYFYQKMFYHMRITRLKLILKYMIFRIQKGLHKLNTNKDLQSKSICLLTS